MPKGKKYGGRKKGTPNKLNADAKAVLADLVHSRAGRVRELWDGVADQDAGRAIALYAQLAEFVMPKQARSEVSGPDGGPLTVEVLSLASKASE